MTMNEDIQLLNEVIKDIEYKLKRKAICAKYRRNNSEKIKASNKRWKAKNLEKINLKQRCRREKIRRKKGLEKFNRPLTINSPFVRVFNSVKNSRKQDCLITIDDVRKQFEKQNGICALSGLKLKTPKHSGERCPKTPDVISIDRINSNKPYTKDNIQLVCVALNYAKNSFTNDEIKNFLKSIPR